VVAEDFVVAELERSDSGPLPLLRLEPRQDLLAARGQVDELVEPRIPAPPEHLPLARGGRQLLLQRALELRGEILETEQRLPLLCEQRRRAAAEPLCER